jgi:hypothetical protein
MGQPCIAGFYPVFKQNMEAIGLPVPTGLFATQQQAAATISQLAGVVKTMGMKVTIRELIGAGTLTEQLAVAAAYSAADYTGGTIGSLLVATDNTLGCAYPVTQALLHRAKLYSAFALTEPLRLLLLRHPEVIDRAFQNRHRYGAMACALGVTKQ